MAQYQQENPVPLGTPDLRNPKNRPAYIKPGQSRDSKDTDNRRPEAGRGKAAMKIFIVVLIIAGIIGGFAGGEINDKTFSAIGASIGVVSVAIILLGLGAFFHHSDEAKRKRGTSSNGANIRRPLSPTPSENPVDKLVQSVHSLLIVQLELGKSNVDKLYALALTNKKIAGYIFGFHDAFLQKNLGITDDTTEIGSEIMEKCYRMLLGQGNGRTLFTHSISLTDDAEFMAGRMLGGGDFVDFTTKKAPPLGLMNILVFELR